MRTWKGHGELPGRFLKVARTAHAIPPKDGIGLVPGDPHGDCLGNLGMGEVSDSRPPKVVADHAGKPCLQVGVDAPPRRVARLGVLSCMAPGLLEHSPTSLCLGAPAPPRRFLPVCSFARVWHRFLDRNRHLPNSGERDRKSTRLNSSHGYISYAVFCLKKKKKEQTIIYICH